MPPSPDIEAACVASHIHTERAIDELRRQSGIVLYAEGRAMGNFPVEFLSEAGLEAMRSPQLRVLLTAARARALGLPHHDAAIAAATLSLPEIIALGDPLAAPTSLPALDAQPASPIDSLALRLAKYASLLPALLRVEESTATASWLRLDAADAQRYIAAPHVEMVETAQATLPIEGAEEARIVSFRSAHSTAVHLALIVGQPGGEPLARIHSSCVTGDILGSLRCDCGDQLKLALGRITGEGGGVLIYLHQEGRGIGITNKLRAYRLQEQGIDTYDANLLLGFEEDERDFSLAAAILKKLGIHAIRMLTNNPHKMAALEKAGIRVAERVPLVTPGGRHNHAYLEAKAQKSGHLF